jgi:hypothetical protein
MFFVGIHPGYSVDPTDASALVVELNRYADFIGRTLPPDEVKQLATARSSSQPEIQALTAALLYRADPIKYRSALSSQFAINDYAARAKGVTVNISQEEFISRIKQTDQTYPSLRPSVALLVNFVRLREANLWFPKGDQRLSVSRFLRGAFFAQVFMGSGLHPVTVANELDQEAREQYEREAASKR